MVKINENESARQQCAKYLEIMIDDKIRWENHMNYINLKYQLLCRGAWIISKLKKYADTKTLKRLYYSLLYPPLKYCITSWGKADTKTFQPLITIQKIVP